MIFKAINNNKIGAYMTMLLFLFLLWIQPFLSPIYKEVSYNIHPMPLWSVIKPFVQGNNIIASIFGLIFALIMSLSVARFSSNYGLLNRQTALPGFIYFVIVAIFSPAQHMSPTWIIALIFLISTGYIYDAHSYRRPAKNCFQASFFLALGSLFYYKAILIFPLLLIIMLMVRVFNFKSFIASIIGIVLPWLISVGYYLVAHGELTQLWNHLEFIQSKVFSSYELTIYHLVMFGVLSLYLLFSLFSLTKNINTKKINTRILYRVVVMCTFYLIILAGATGYSFEFLPITAIPLAFLFAHFLDNIKSPLWQNIMLILLIALVVSSQIVA